MLLDYRIAQKGNFDELIVDFIGETRNKGI